MSYDVYLIESQRVKLFNASTKELVNVGFPTLINFASKDMAKVDEKMAILKAKKPHLVFNVIKATAQI